MPDSYASFEALNKKRRILVVEDEIINQEILGLILSETYEVVMAGTGEAALADIGADERQRRGVGRMLSHGLSLPVKNRLILSASIVTHKTWFVKRYIL